MLHGGVWNKDTTLMLNRAFRDGKDWSISLEESKAGDGDINGYSLTKIVAKINGNIDILKIDIEGAEKMIFEDETATDFLNKVKCIAIEIHDELFIREKIYSVLKEIISSITIPGN
jgi:FkbM family methyltransferase